MPPKKPQPPKKPNTNASSTRKIKVKPMRVGKRGAVYTVTKTGARRYRKRVGKVKLPRLKLTSSQKRRQKAVLKQISPLKKKLTQKKCITLQYTKFNYFNIMGANPQYIHYIHKHITNVTITNVLEKRQIIIFDCYSLRII